MPQSACYVLRNWKRIKVAQLDPCLAVAIAFWLDSPTLLKPAQCRTKLATQLNRLMADPFAYLDCLLCVFDQRLDASDNFIVVSYHGYPTLGEIAMPTAHDPFHTNLGDWRHGSSESVRPVADTLGTDWARAEKRP